jgi:general stress protein YciG
VPDEQEHASIPAENHTKDTKKTRPQADQPSSVRKRKPGPKPGTEAARRGELAAAAKMGRERYREIGKKGGKAVRERHGIEFYTTIGRKGGSTTKTRHGHEHYEQISRIGGAHHRRQPEQESEPGIWARSDEHRRVACE